VNQDREARGFLRLIEKVVELSARMALEGDEEELKKLDSEFMSYAEDITKIAHNVIYFPTKNLNHPEVQ
jgi:hypothetical protein